VYYSVKYDTCIRDYLKEYHVIKLYKIVYSLEERSEIIFIYTAEDQYEDQCS